VRTNADLPEDAKRAREFGAEGIGLCRTEHMFLGDRLPIVPAHDPRRHPDEETAALEQLRAQQESDFVGILEAMDGLPVTCVCSTRRCTSSCPITKS
jgi:pyruvate,orthophosphate dikinase